MPQRHRQLLHAGDAALDGGVVAVEGDGREGHVAR
jgi:hypothetical protein